VSDKLRLLDLFSGIGGFSLGLERSGGFETVAFCEIEDFPRRVLAKHWPKVPCYHDIKELTAARLAADGIAVDAICGGFPCQDISTAGKGAGIEGERSGLWGEYARLIGELRPRVVFVENVAALLGRGLDRVLGDLASLGYDAVWDCIPASAVGAPHQRDRFWLVAYPVNNGSQVERWPTLISTTQLARLGGNGGTVSDANQSRLEGGLFSGIAGQEVPLAAAGRRETMADPASLGQQGQGQSCERRNQAPDGQGQADNAFSVCVGNQWSLEPDVGRVANGVPARVDRLKGLGNAVVPQIPELLGRAYLQAMETTHV
jgi:DNA (cytosine-5)-methyltransferase 1